MLRLWGIITSYYWGKNQTDNELEEKNDEERSEDWVYLESEAEQLMSLKAELDAEIRKHEIQQIHSANLSGTNSRTRWTEYFTNVLANHKYRDEEFFTFDLPLSMRTSIMQSFVRNHKDMWAKILKYFHDLKINDLMETRIEEKWDSFETSFIRIPKLNNKGKEGAIIDFALLSYDGVITGKSLSRILWAWCKTMTSFLETDFSITLQPTDISNLEEMLSPSILEIIEMHITACKQSCDATKKLGLVTNKWVLEKKDISTLKIDAKYETPTRMLVQDNEKPKESIIELQRNLMNSMIHKPVKRQVEEIPSHEKMITAAFYDARTRLQTNLGKIDRAAVVQRFSSENQ